jgi:hypothetical protein
MEEEGGDDGGGVADGEEGVVDTNAANGVVVEDREYDHQHVNEVVGLRRREEVWIDSDGVDNPWVVERSFHAAGTVGAFLVLGRMTNEEAGTFVACEEAGVLWNSR